MTFVLLLEDGIWKIVQVHNSVAVPNPEAVGVELTTTLEELLSALGSNAESELRRKVREGSVTLVFTDVEESTGWAERLGDESWAGVIRWHDETIDRMVAKHGGVVVKTLGEGAIKGLPGVHEVVPLVWTDEGTSNRPAVHSRKDLHPSDRAT